MKKSELQDIIRELVKEEVKNIIPTILEEVACALSGRKPILKEETVRRPATIPVRQTSVPVQQKTAVKRFSNNPVLNKILSETQGGISYDDPTSMRASMTEGVEYEQPPAETGVPLEAAGFLNKDYSQVLKQMKEAAERTRPM